MDGLARVARTGARLAHIYGLASLQVGSVGLAGVIWHTFQAHELIRVDGGKVKAAPPLIGVHRVTRPGVCAVEDDLDSGDGVAAAFGQYLRPVS